MHAAYDAAGAQHEAQHDATGAQHEAQFISGEGPLGYATAGYKFQFSQLAFQHRSAVREVQGCPSVLQFLKLSFEAMPFVMRGCAFELGTLHEWSDEQLVEHAGEWFGGDLFQKQNLSLRRFVELRNEHRLPYSAWCNMPYALRRCLGVPSLLHCKPLLALLTSNHMRITDTGEEFNGLHVDQGMFLQAQLDGEKHWTFVDPIDSLALGSDDAWPQGKPIYGYQIFRYEGVDVARYPKILDVPVQVVTVTAGDLLYSPEQWWHEIVILPGRNLAINLNLDLYRSFGESAPLEPSSSGLIESAMARRVKRRERPLITTELWRSCSSQGAAEVTQAEFDVQLQQQLNASPVQNC